MRRYYFELLDNDYNDLGTFIPDGSSKKSALNRAKRWMAENGVQEAILSVNSMITNNILDMIHIELNN